MEDNKNINAEEWASEILNNFRKHNKEALDRMFCDQILFPIEIMSAEEIIEKYGLKINNDENRK